MPLTDYLQITERIYIKWYCPEINLSIMANKVHESSLFDIYHVLDLEVKSNKTDKSYDIK